MCNKIWKVYRWFICVVFILFMSIWNVLPITAAGLDDTGLYKANKQERSLMDDVESVSDIQYMRARNGHLMYGSIELSKISPTRAGILATTQAYHVCPNLYMDIYLDRYDPNTGLWNQLRYWEFSTINNDHLTKNMEIIVKSGYYYSIRGYHICVHGDVMETAETMTDGLYIGTTDKPIL